MKGFKRILFVLFAVTLIFTLCACGDTTASGGFKKSVDIEDWLGGGGGNSNGGGAVVSEDSITQSDGGESSNQAQPDKSNTTQPQASSTKTPTVSSTPTKSSTPTVSSAAQNPPTSVVTPTEGTLTANQQAILKQAENAVTWQLDNGGWDKDYSTHVTKAWTSGSKITKGWKANGKDLGTIDNDGTYSEMALIANAYSFTGRAALKASFEKAMAFLKNLEGPKGGFKQVYPKRGNYSDNVTFNDDATVSVLLVLEKIRDSKAPYNTDIVSSANRTLAGQMITRAVDYMIKSQITVQGAKSGWCAQHDPSSYAPVKARNYELASISGAESIGVIVFLKRQTGNAEAQAAAQAAINWFKAHKIENMSYSKRRGATAFVASQGNDCWFRFYDLTTGEGFFCTRNVKVFKGLSSYSQFYAADSERATGYDWAGTWLKKYGFA